MISIFNQFNETIGEYTGVNAASYIVAIIILVIFFVLAQVVNFMFNKVFTAITGRTKNDIDDEIVKTLNMPIFYSVVLFGAYQSLTYIPALSAFSGDFSRIVKSIAIIIWTFAISNLASIVITGLGFRFAEKTKSTLDDELMPLFKKLSRVIIYFAGAMILLQTWSLDITPLLASAGIAGFVIAFAAQDTISHLFGGVSIYFDKPFKVGDRIQLESGEVGDVLEIGIRSTRIKTFDETVVIMPNNKIASSKIINYNQPGLKIKSKIKIGVSYNSDVEKVKKILLEIAQNTEGILNDPSPSVYFSEFGDFSLKFILIGWVSNPKKQFVVEAKINEEILRRFNEEKITIPYPTQEVIMKNMN